MNCFFISADKLIKIKKMNHSSNEIYSCLIKKKCEEKIKNIPNDQLNVKYYRD